MKQFLTFALACFPLMCIGAPSISYTSYFNNVHVYTNITLGGVTRNTWPSSSGIAGTVINTGASTVGAVPVYTDTTGTNVAPSTTFNLGTSTNATLTGNLLANGATFTNGITSGASTFTGQVGFADGNSTAPGISFSGSTGVGFYRVGGIIYFASGGNPRVSLGNNQLTGASGTIIGWSSSATDPASPLDTVLVRDAANTLALRNGANAQTFNIYNTYTDASNYERGLLRWTANQLQLGTAAAGTGSSRTLFIWGNTLSLGSSTGSARWNINSSGHFLAQDDNTYDIGAVNATRPKNGFFGGDVTVNLTVGTAVTLSSTNHFYLCNVDAQTITLPTAVGIKGKEYEIKLISPAETGTVATTSSQLIDGAASYSLSASNKFVRVVSDGTNWWNFGSN